MSELRPRGGLRPHSGLRPRIGLLPTGHFYYWDQFPELKGYASCCTSSVRCDVMSGNRLLSDSLRPWHFAGASP